MNAVYWLILIIVLVVLGFRVLLAQPKIRRQWDRFILHAPVVGVLNRKICTARFASTLSNLYGSGVPIITTLGAARDAIGNRWIESQFADALDGIRAGHSLSEAIAAIDGFETKLSSSIAVGEETGKLDTLLATISETLDYEAEMATKRLVTLLEPVMIVIMGIVVGGVVAQRNEILANRDIDSAVYIETNRQPDQFILHFPHQEDIIVHTIEELLEKLTL